MFGILGCGLGVSIRVNFVSKTCLCGSESFEELEDVLSA